MSSGLDVLCAGAVKGLLQALEGDVERTLGHRLRAQFGAVGALRDLLRSGAACDVFIASAAMVESLQASGELRAGSARAIGRVQTAIAVRATAPRPSIGDADDLRRALEAASALYFPDATLSTAGAHVAAMLERLGLRDALAGRLRMFANGATAMRELAARGDDASIGCTQATEIRCTPGLDLVAALPPPFALSTVYSAAVAARAEDDEAAGELIERLAGPLGARLRAAGGFDVDAAGSR